MDLSSFFEDEVVYKPNVVDSADIQTVDFPIIETIDDVLPAIQGRDEFIVADRGDYKIINYVVNTPDTFPEVKTTKDALLRECRGLTFYPDGRVMRRLFHKFFNLNEKLENLVENVDFSKRHRVLMKLDGSMISPLFINGEVRWGTKMGLTETAVDAENFAKARPQYDALALECEKFGNTPIFEFCSRKNRIVLDYPEDQLILLAIRDNKTGYYMSYDSLCFIGNMHEIPVVEEYGSESIKNIDDFVNVLRTQEGTEGVVVTFDDGHKIKIKTDWYVKIHKAKEVVTREYVLAELILQDKIDDVKPLLLKQDLEYVEEFSAKLLKTLKKYSQQVFDFHFEKGDYLTRKEFALGLAKQLPHIVTSAIFTTWDKHDLTFCHEVVKNMFLKNTTHQKKYEEFKKEYL